MGKYFREEYAGTEIRNLGILNGNRSKNAREFRSNLKMNIYFFQAPKLRKNYFDLRKIQKM